MIVHKWVFLFVCYVVLLIKIHISTRLTSYYLLGDIQKTMNELNNGIHWYLIFFFCFLSVFMEIFVNMYCGYLQFHIYYIFILVMQCSWYIYSISNGYRLIQNHLLIVGCFWLITFIKIEKALSTFKVLHGWYRTSFFSKLIMLWCLLHMPIFIIYVFF